MNKIISRYLLKTKDMWQFNFSGGRLNKNQWSIFWEMFKKLMLQLILYLLFFRDLENYRNDEIDLVKN